MSAASHPTPLWVAKDVCRALGVRAMHGRQADFCARGVAIDSRAVRAGDIFLALKDKRDGADFAPDAVAKGAVAVIAERPLTDLEVPVLVVRNSYHALWDLARAARARSCAICIGITGSCGKTSVKEALALALRPFGLVYAAPASFNNHIGVPLSLANLPPMARYGVFELGMNHAGEIATLTRLLRPHFAMITNIGPAHLENFASLNAIADAKAEVFSDMSAAAVVVLPQNSAHYTRLVAAARRCGVRHIVNVGSAQLRYEILQEPDASYSQSHGHWVQAVLGAQSVRYYLPQLGTHMVENSLMVLACVAALGEDVTRAAHALEAWQAPAGRGRMHRLALADGACLLIDDSYNANPASMAAAFEMLAHCRKDGVTARTVAVLGDMLELGAGAPQAHRALAERLAAQHIDRVYLCGELMAHLWRVLPHGRKGAYVREASKLLDILRSDLRVNDAVMVKASRAMALDTLVTDLLADSSAHAHNSRRQQHAL